MQVLSYTILAEEAPSLPELGHSVDTAMLAAAISAFVPIVVAFITKREASDRLKAVVNLLSVAVASVVALFLNGNNSQPITWQLVASTFFTGLVASIAAFKAVWKPLQVTPKIATATENFGLGKPVPTVIETARPASRGVQE